MGAKPGAQGRVQVAAQQDAQTVAHLRVLEHVRVDVRAVALALVQETVIQGVMGVRTNARDIVEITARVHALITVWITALRIVPAVQNKYMDVYKYWIHINTTRFSYRELHYML